MIPHDDTAKRDAMAHAARRADREDATFWVWYVNHEKGIGGRPGGPFTMVYDRIDRWTVWYVLPEGEEPEFDGKRLRGAVREWPARPESLQSHNWGPQGLLPWEGTEARGWPRRVPPAE